MNIRTYTVLIIGVLMLALSSCGKEFLEKRQIKNQRVPQSVEDFALLASGEFYNQSSYKLSITGTDEFLVPESRYNSLLTSNPISLDAYTWKREFDLNLYDSKLSGDWEDAYAHILRMNIALTGLGNLVPKSTEVNLYNKTRGIALFYRAHRYFQLSLLYALPYDAEHDSPFGLPLRLSDEVTQRVSRSTVHKTYEQILLDLHTCIPLLLELRNAQQYNKPFRSAGYSLLANVYLTMSDYKNAAKYADSALQLNPALLDYNLLGADDPANRYTFHFGNDRFGKSNPEMNFYNVCLMVSGATPQLQSSANALINPDFITLYHQNDLRKTINFKPNSATSSSITYKGSFGGANAAFVGFTSGENYIVAAEAYVRTGEIDKALNRLNILRKSRFLTGTFVEVTERDPEHLLRFILEERKRELFARGRRWEDLRRLNKDPRFAETLVRELPGMRHELPPNDTRYTWPIPQSEVDIGGVQQISR